MDAQNVGPLGPMSTHTTVLKRIRNAFKTYARISNVLSVYQRTCLFFHTSVYVGAIRRSVTGPLTFLSCSYSNTCVKRSL